MLLANGTSVLRKSSSCIAGDWKNDVTGGNIFLANSSPDQGNAEMPGLATTWDDVGR